MEWHFERDVLARLDELIRIDKEILAAQERPRPPATATALSILFSKAKGENMPLILPLGDQDTYSIVGTAPFLGALLAAGQTLNVISADPATVVITPDATAQPTPAGTAGAPVGTPAIGSGTVTAASSPAQPNVAIAITATVVNPDGSAAETISDTVTVSPGAATAIGELFGVAVPITATAGATAAVKAAAKKSA